MQYRNKGRYLMEKYLEVSEFIDWDNPQILALAKELADGQNTDIEIAKACFEWVRDEIKHSWDYKLDQVTCKASDVLKHGNGYCYAKSHLLAALLRANHIPCGLCYQRLSINDDGAPYSLHGLNAVYLNEFGWYKIDARGNKEGVDAQFTPPKEQLAFALQDENEKDFEEIYVKPFDEVTRVLTKLKTSKEVFENLPDKE